MKLTATVVKKTMKAKSKAGPKAKTNNPLKKGQLNKLGTMSLQEKIKKLSEDKDDEVEAAMVLEDAMTPEKSRAWNRHNKQLKKAGQEEALFTDANNKEKGS